MSDLTAIVQILQTHEIEFAVIGAAAFAVHARPRSTADLDLFSVDERCLTKQTWESLPFADFELRHGDMTDPLAGVARFRPYEPDQIDVVVGHGAPWQRDAIRRAGVARVHGMSLPVVTAPDLILLKLYAGGNQDRWDIEELLAIGDRAALITAVESFLPALQRDARELWSRIRG